MKIKMKIKKIKIKKILKIIKILQIIVEKKLILDL